MEISYSGIEFDFQFTVVLHLQGPSHQKSSLLSGQISNALRNLNTSKLSLHENPPLL
jgi:hypothetical protein